MLTLDGQRIELETLWRVAMGELSVKLSEGAKKRMAASRAVVEQILKEGRIVYGINTGFGKLSEVHIPPEELDQLQLNLVRSHSCGVGDPLSKEEVRAMMLL